MFRTNLNNRNLANRNQIKWHPLNTDIIWAWFLIYFLNMFFFFRIQIDLLTDKAKLSSCVIKYWVWFPTLRVVCVQCTLIGECSKFKSRGWDESPILKVKNTSMYNDAIPLSLQSKCSPLAVRFQWNTGTLNVGLFQNIYPRIYNHLQATFSKRPHK